MPSAVSPQQDANILDHSGLFVPEHPICLEPVRHGTKSHPSVYEADCYPSVRASQRNVFSRFASRRCNGPKAIRQSVKAEYLRRYDSDRQNRLRILKEALETSEALQVSLHNLEYIWDYLTLDEIRVGVPRIGLMYDNLNPRLEQLHYPHLEFSHVQNTNLEFSRKKGKVSAPLSPKDLIFYEDQRDIRRGDGYMNRPLLLDPVVPRARELEEAAKRYWQTQNLSPVEKDSIAATFIRQAGETSDSYFRDLVERGFDKDKNKDRVDLAQRHAIDLGDIELYRVIGLPSEGRLKTTALELTIRAEHVKMHHASATMSKPVSFWLGKDVMFAIKGVEKGMCILDNFTDRNEREVVIPRAAEYEITDRSCCVAFREHSRGRKTPERVYQVLTMVHVKEL